MPTPLEFQIRLLIARYVTGQMKRDQFEDALLNATWELNDPASRHLVGAVELYLAEFTNGHLTTDQLKTRLRQLNSGTGVVPAIFRADIRGTANQELAQPVVAAPG